MKLIDFPIERLNDVLNKESFELPNFLGYGGSFPKIKGNVELTGVKKYITMGEKIPYVEFTLHLTPEDEQSAEFLDLMMGKKDVINYSTSDTSFHSVLQKVQDKIESFLKIFSVPHRSICTKIINTRPNFITESLLREGKYDGITRILVRDIIQLYKYQREGEFDLPDAITSDKEYEIPNFHHNFSLRLNLELDDNVEMIDVDGQYFDDESTIEITIKTNPTFKYSPEVLQTLIKELNEVVRHELEHLKQYALGKQHRKEPKNHEKYYSQPDEIEAQRAGFKRRSKQEKIPMEYIVRKWFKDNEHKYKMNPDQIERVIDKILISK